MVVAGAIAGATAAIGGNRRKVECRVTKLQQELKTETRAENG